MAVADDIANDYEYVDGVENVTFQARGPDQSASGSAVANVKALARVVNKQALQAFPLLGLQPTDRVFHLWVSTLGAATPSQGDTIQQADGTVWTILAASLETLETRWRCPCRKQVT